MSKRRAQQIDLRKRNRLIKSFLARGGKPDPDALLTDKDRDAIRQARECAAKSRSPRSEIIAFGRPTRGRCDFCVGDWYFNVEPICRLCQQYYAGEGLDFSPLSWEPEHFQPMSAGGVFEELIRRNRARLAGSIRTIGVVEFFDGNWDRQSIAPNVVDSDSGPSFESIRDTLLRIARDPHVSAAGVEIHELPDPDQPADDDLWIAAERVFVWTTEPVKSVRSWVRGLRPDGVARAELGKVLPPAPLTLPPKTKVYEIAWD